MSSKRTRALAQRISRYNDRPAMARSALGKELLELDGYLTGLGYIDADDIGQACFSIAMGGVVRVSRRQALVKSPSPPKDKPMAKIYELLGRQYIGFGDWSTASECFGWSALYWRGAGTRRTLALSILCSIRAGQLTAAADYLSNIEPGAPGAPRTFVRICKKILDPAADLRDEVTEVAAVRSFSFLVSSYLASCVAQRLAADGQLNFALKMIEWALADLDSVKAPEWLIGDFEQREANIRLALGELDQASATAKAAWTKLDTPRYRSCSHEQRLSTWKNFGTARYTALQAAVALGDGQAVAELIESCRLQTMIATELEVEHSEEQRKLDAVGTSDSPESSSAKEHLSVGTSIFTAINDGFNSTRLHVPTPLSPRSASTPSGAFWSTHIENGVMFWFLALDGEHLGHGRMDLRDHEHLQPILRALAGYSGSSEPSSWSLPPYQLEAGDHFEPVHDLASWKSPEEQIISVTIGRLLPDRLVDLLHRATRANPLHLTIAATRELAAVPWALTVIRGTEERLIERAVLRMWTSMWIHRDRAARPKPPEGSASPFLVACDNPDGTLRARSDFSTLASAHTVLKSGATKAELLTALRQVGPGTLGLFYYHGHAQHDADPSYSALPLADEPVHAGELFGAFPDGEPFVPMPYRVILSCCSGSTSALLGGESAGLAAGVIRSGAEHVLATGIDLFDSSFTEAFEDILIKGMMMPDADAAVLLRAAQLRMLREWKMYSLRGGTDYRDDFKDPHPIIWAAYQAY